MIKNLLEFNISTSLSETQGKKYTLLKRKHLLANKCYVCGKNLLVNEKWEVYIQNKYESLELVKEEHGLQQSAQVTQLSSKKEQNVNTVNTCILFVSQKSLNIFKFFILSYFIFFQRYCQAHFPRMKHLLHNQYCFQKQTVMITIPHTVFFQFHHAMKKTKLPFNLWFLLSLPKVQLDEKK